MVIVAACPTATGCWNAELDLRIALCQAPDNCGDPDGAEHRRGLPARATLAARRFAYASVERQIEVSLGDRGRGHEDAQERF